MRADSSRAVCGAACRLACPTRASQRAHTLYHCSWPAPRPELASCRLCQLPARPTHPPQPHTTLPTIPAITVSFSYALFAHSTTNSQEPRRHPGNTLNGRSASHPFCPSAGHTTHAIPQTEQVRRAVMAAHLAMVGRGSSLQPILQGRDPGRRPRRQARRLSARWLFAAPQRRPRLLRAALCLSSGRRATRRLHCESCAHTPARHGSRH